MRLNRTRTLTALVAGFLAVAFVVDVQFHWPSYLRSLARHHAQLERDELEKERVALRLSREAEAPDEAARYVDEAKGHASAAQHLGFLTRMQFEAADHAWRSYFARQNWRFDL
jgi:hypothetical protein